MSEKNCNFSIIYLARASQIITLFARSSSSKLHSGRNVHRCTHLKSHLMSNWWCIFCTKVFAYYYGIVISFGINSYEELCFDIWNIIEKWSHHDKLMCLFLWVLFLLMHFHISCNLLFAKFSRREHWILDTEQ